MVKQLRLNVFNVFRKSTEHFVCKKIWCHKNNDNNINDPSLTENVISAIWVYHSFHDINVLFLYISQTSQMYLHNRAASTMYTADGSIHMTNGILTLDVRSSPECTNPDHPNGP